MYVMRHKTWFKHFDSRQVWAVVGAVCLVVLVAAMVAAMVLLGMWLLNVDVSEFDITRLAG